MYSAYIMINFLIQTIICHVIYYYKIKTKKFDFFLSYASCTKMFPKKYSYTPIMFFLALETYVSKKT